MIFFGLICGILPFVIPDKFFLTMLNFMNFVGIGVYNSGMIWLPLGMTKIDRLVSRIRFSPSFL